MDTSIADYYIAVNGNDAWSGTLPEVKADGTDGPFATLQRARDSVRALKRKKKAPITVLVREGTYYLKEPLIFERNPERVHRRGFLLPQLDVPEVEVTSILPPNVCTCFFWRSTKSGPAIFSQAG